MAHLTAAGKPTLTAYVNDTSAVAAGKARIIVRHDAAAPAVDLRANGKVAFAGLTNPKQVQADLPAGSIKADVVLAGTSSVAIGPATLDLKEGTATVVYAVGSASAKTLTLVSQTIDGLHSAPKGVQAGAGGSWTPTAARLGGCGQPACSQCWPVASACSAPPAAPASRTRDRRDGRRRRAAQIGDHHLGDRHRRGLRCRCLHPPPLRGALVPLGNAGEDLRCGRTHPAGRRTPDHSSRRLGLGIVAHGQTNEASDFEADLDVDIESDPITVELTVELTVVVTGAVRFDGRTDEPEHQRHRHLRPGRPGRRRRRRRHGRQEYPKTAVPLAALFTRTGAPHLTLITCGGSFNSTIRHYRDNVVVTAVPIASR